LKAEKKPTLAAVFLTKNGTSSFALFLSLSRGASLIKRATSQQSHIRACATVSHVPEASNHVHGSDSRNTNNKQLVAEDFCPRLSKILPVELILAYLATLRFSPPFASPNAQ